MKKLLILISFVFFLIGCSKFSEIKENIVPSNKLQYKIKKLALNLDNSLKFLKLRQKKLIVNDFIPIGKGNKRINRYLKLKLEEELFNLGYIVSNDKGIITVEGHYIDLGKKLEIMAFIKGDGIKVAESSIILTKDSQIESLFSGNINQQFLTLER